MFVLNSIGNRLFIELSKEPKQNNPPSLPTPHVNPEPEAKPRIARVSISTESCPEMAPRQDSPTSENTQVWPEPDEIARGIVSGLMAITVGRENSKCVPMLI